MTQPNVNPHDRAYRREGGDLLVEALASRGVTSIFTVSGGPINSVYRASLSSPLDMKHVRHEASAGFMADAIYRTTGKPGIAVVTLGPGAANMATPLGTALRAGTPMLVIGAQSPTTNVDRGAVMELGTLASMRPMVKWAASVPRVERIAEYVEMAWRVMLSPTPGPVYLEIPSDILSAPVSDDVRAPAPAKPLLPPAPHAEALREAAAILSACRKPLLLVGDGVAHEGSQDQVRQLVERYGIPFSTLRLARGAVDERSESCIGPGYVPANATLRRALAEADAILLLGHEWEADLQFGQSLPDGVRVVQVLADASKLGRMGSSDLAIVSGVGPFVGALSDHRLFTDVDRGWISDIARQWRAEHDRSREAAAGDGPLHPVALVEEVQRAAPPDTCFVTSHGNTDFWADGHLVVPADGRYLRAGQSGALGAEISFALAAKLAEPDRPAIVFLGDGAIGYHGVELDTAVRYGANIIVVVADDEKWGAIAIPQREVYGVEVEMDLPRRDWVGFARSLGARGEYVAGREGIAEAVGRALDAKVPTLLHVPVLSTLSPYMAYASK